MNQYMQIAVNEAKKGMQSGAGGPFGAVIVCDGQIIAQGHNEVIETNDPTAHAEIVVIRKAAAKLGRFDLSDCEIYSSCQPCPMCFAAIHWAKMKKLYYACTKEDARNIGFDDDFIYDVIKGKAAREQVASVQIDRNQSLEPFEIWQDMAKKVQY
ncbi:MAG: nucleoside deaminase [Candidatus Gracilibacteria bacterium]|jgi:guanine deaminase|nr:nucleoside deaminase [Candidatus Gracilibacteria bacterium]